MESWLFMSLPACLSICLAVCPGFLGFLRVFSRPLLLCSFVPNELHSKGIAEYRSWQKSMAMATSKEWITKLPDGSLIPGGARRRVLAEERPPFPLIVCLVVSPQIVDVRFNFSPC